MSTKSMGRTKRPARRLLTACLLGCLSVSPLTLSAQRLLTLDSCRAMAMRNNKQMGISAQKQTVAMNLRKSARTKYLPHVSAIGTYQFTSEEVSLLNAEQKAKLPNLGTAMGTSLQTGLDNMTAQLPMPQIGAMLGQLGIPLEGIQQMMSQNITDLSASLNAEGQSIADAFNTDTRNFFSGAVMVVQPIFLGGSIIAANRLADLNEQLAGNSAEARRQLTIYNTDQVYWQVVSLKHKLKLAESYLELVRKLDADVHKMIDEGVATRSDGLSVDVKVNEAEMTVTKVSDGLVLSRMLLCQTIGLPLNEPVILADEDSENVAAVVLTPTVDVEQAVDNRPELRMLQNSVEMSRQTTNILKAGNLPQLLLTGGYAVSNPNVQNGFQKKFGGFWNVGLLLRVPLWNWGDVAYKVRAAKGATAIASLEMEEAREKMELQLNQTTFKVDECNKRLAMAQTSVARADENLRTANLGFSEGVITPTTVMEAQTAWLQAQSQKIDAEIDVRLSQVELRKAMGTLDIER